jgi:Methylenetetrahydrofolate reductase
MLLHARRAAAALTLLMLPQSLLLLLLLQFCVETMMHLTCTNMPMEKLDNALAEVCVRVLCVRMCGGSFCLLRG